MYRLITFFLFFSLVVNGQILFSEYAEGSSYNKYLEIYNYSNEQVNLSGYAFPSCSNGCDQEGEWDYIVASGFPPGQLPKKIKFKYFIYTTSRNDFQKMYDGNLYILDNIYIRTNIKPMKNWKKINNTYLY